MTCERCGHTREEHEMRSIHSPCNVRNYFSAEPWHCTCYAFVAPHAIGTCCALGICGEVRAKKALELYEQYNTDNAYVESGK